MAEMLRRAQEQRKIMKKKLSSEVSQRMELEKSNEREGCGQARHQAYGWPMSTGCGQHGWVSVNKQPKEADLGEGQRHHGGGEGIYLEAGMGDQSRTNMARQSLSPKQRPLKHSVRCHVT